MSALMASCLETGCCSFDYYSEAASSGSGPEIKSSSVSGTKLCREGTPGGAGGDDPAVGKVYVWDDYQVTVNTITRGTPLWISSTPFGKWRVPVTIEYEISSTCDDCDDQGPVVISHEQKWDIECSPTGYIGKFTIEQQAGFPTGGSLCSGGVTVSAAWQNGTPRVEDAVLVADISGDGCAAYDQNVFTVQVPITGTTPFIAPIPGECRDVTLVDFPGGSGAVITMEWSILSP
jgi:hypothetical protein